MFKRIWNFIKFFGKGILILAAVGMLAGLKELFDLSGVIFVIIVFIGTGLLGFWIRNKLIKKPKQE